MKPKKLLSFILTAAMAISLLPTFTLTASATTTTEKKITLGTAALSGYDSTNKYKYVYYGTYDNSPIKWRILSMNGNDGTYYESNPYTPTQAPTAPEDGKVYTDSDETTKFIYLAKSGEYYKQTTSTPMFLLSEYALKQMAYELAWNSDDGDGQTYPSDWRYSDAWYWCNDTTDSTSFISSSFTPSEEAYFLKTSKDNTRSPYTDELKGDTFFFLSYAEADNIYTESRDLVAKMSNASGNAAWWWLRSPVDYYNVFCVFEDGNFYNCLVEIADPAARPAFNLNLSSVLFTSAAYGGKSSTAAAGGGAEISKNADYTIGDDEKYEYKLTMLDESRYFKVTEKSVTGTKGETVTLHYENAETDTNEYISAMIVDDNDEVLYYGQLKNISDSADENGTVDFKIPSDIDYGTYKLKLFNEQINGDYKTDYSSEFETVTLSVRKTPSASDFTFTPPTDLTYDGNKKTATVTSSQSGMGDVTVKYYDESGTKLENAPTDVGKYTVKIDVADGDNYTAASYLAAEDWKFEITKATASLTTPTTTAITYGAALSTVGLPNGWVWADGNTIPTVTNSGYTAYYTPADTSNYDWTAVEGWNASENRVERTVAVTVNKQIVTKPTIASKAYTGTELRADVPESERYTASQTQHTYYGEYDVILTLTDSANYKWSDTDSADTTVKFNITTAENAWITEPSISGWTYGQTASEPRYKAMFGTVEVEYKKADEADDKYTADVPSNAGVYKARFSVEATNNYGTLSKEVDFTINKAKVTKPTENTTVFTYDKTVQTYSLTENELYEISNNTRTDAGSQNVTVTLKDKNNYEWADGTTEDLTYTFTIKEAKITPVITLTAPVKNATPQTSLDTTEYTATVDWSPTVDTNGTFAKSTEYTATITITPKANYTVSGIAENGYTLDGATSVTNTADSNVVTAVFPKTAGSSGGGSSVTRYTVKFDTDGGSTIANQTVTKNSKATEPTKPTKEGYIFDAWYTDSEFATEYDFDTKVTKNITLYAKWFEDEIQEPSDDNIDDEPPTDEWKNPFTDVTENDWFFDNVKYANENGLMSGVTNTTFAPNDSLTRAMLVTVLWRTEGEPNVDFAMPFTDVADTAYYAEAVRWAASENIVNGVTETEFAPDMNITREQIAAIIYRYAKYKGYDVSVGEDTNILSYADFDEISEYAISAMQYAVGSGLMKGKTESTLNPKDNATRAEIAAILNRFIEANK